MGVMHITENDMRMMVKNAVARILLESEDEVRGSIMAEREDAIESFVNDIIQWWEAVKDQKPNNMGTFSLVGIGDSIGEYKDYVTVFDASKIGIGDNFMVNVTVRNFIVPEKCLQYFGKTERSTAGVSHGSEKYMQFNKSTMKFKNSRVDLTITALNGELQLSGLYSTLYHELNHASSMLNISKKAYNKNYEGMIGKNFFDATRVKEPEKRAHFIVTSSLYPDAPEEFMNKFFYGDEYEKFREVNYLFYALWEITELNARAEEIYGELQHAKISRDQFEEFYKETGFCHHINEFKKMLEDIKKVKDNSIIWKHVARIIHEKTSGRAKRRFLSRTEELINKLYNRGMRVAKLYFDRHEKAPGM